MISLAARYLLMKLPNGNLSDCSKVNGGRKKQFLRFLHSNTKI